MKTFAAKSAKTQGFLHLVHYLFTTMCATWVKLQDWQSDLDSVRQELPGIMEKILGWLNLAAIVVTVVLAWIGFSQVSLLAHAWRWCRGS